MRFGQRSGHQVKLNASPTGFASGRSTARMLWKQISENHQEFVEPRYLPAGQKIKDPSSMVKEEIEDILSLWRARQTMDSGKNRFWFKKCFINAANKDLQPSTYGAAPKHNSAARGRKKSGKRKGQPLLLHLYMNTWVFPKSLHKSTPGIPHHPKKKGLCRCARAG